ncbi:MAG: tRNA (adenosine(37)-N6)-threonylcarbamoyltransferase complex ATPase subunit type 1 TsaE [Chromatiaceae bacterium]|nr:MAG: tRNA (adenosine(37)-N6)-threonylcarbamoyltransferase complex ATPase subunit type 1 TsaE [Chromatiaceae bacterium]
MSAPGGAGIVVSLPDAAAQHAWGGRLAAALAGRPGVIYLQGELGVGKTTLVRGLLHALGHRGPVRSPTYTLIEPYETLTPPVWHLDLYRLGDAGELEYLGLADLLDGRSLLLIEWPERGAGALPAADLRVQLDYAGNGRRLTLTAAPAWQAVLTALAAGTRC